MYAIVNPFLLKEIIFSIFFVAVMEKNCTIFNGIKKSVVNIFSTELFQYILSLYKHTDSKKKLKFKIPI